MKLTGLSITFILFLGCEHISNADLNPPSPPAGLATETGDNFLELFWRENPEPDVAGYHIFVSSSYEGPFEMVGSAPSGYFFDHGVRNGYTYYYAVTAYDFAGNESSLSRDVVYDIPRPEGYDATLYDHFRIPALAGYDFSAYSVVPYDDLYADMYFENYQGELYMVVREDTDIQDVGYTSSLLDIPIAPASGWSETHDVHLIDGHTYVVWTWDDHYAKFRVTSLSPTLVTFDWAYQLQESNPMLKRGVVGSTRSLYHTDRTR